MKKPVDFDWYCKTKKDVINNAAYELIVALTAKSAPPRKFELSIPQRDDEMIANVVEGAINAVEAQIGYYCHPFYQEADMLPCYLGNRCDNPHCIFKDASGRPKVQPSEREEDPEEGGMTMADEKRYFSVKDMFEQAVTRAKTDPRYEEYSKICELDYDLLCSTCKYDKLYRCEFDVVGEVTYGSSEGIYGDIFLYGNWSKERDDPFKSRARVYVLKTLKQDKESYLAVGMLVNLICYYANEFVATHLDRFD